MNDASSVPPKLNPPLGLNETSVNPFGSYIEVEIGCGCLNLYERMGDGKTCELKQVLERYGLRLKTRVSSPCG